MSQIEKQKIIISNYVTNSHFTTMLYEILILFFEVKKPHSYHR